MIVGAVTVDVIDTIDVVSRTTVVGWSGLRLASSSSLRTKLRYASLSTTWSAFLFFTAVSRATAAAETTLDNKGFCSPGGRLVHGASIGGGQVMHGGWTVLVVSTTLKVRVVFVLVTRLAEKTVTLEGVIVMVCFKVLDGTVVVTGSRVMVYVSICVTVVACARRQRFNV